MRCIMYCKPKIYFNQNTEVHVYQFVYDLQILKIFDVFETKGRIYWKITSSL